MRALEAILAVCLLSLLAGCGNGRDVDIHIQISDAATDTPLALAPAGVEATAEAEPVQPGASPVATGSAAVEPTATQPQPVAATESQAQAAAPTDLPPTQPPVASPLPPTEAPPAPTLPPAPTQAPQLPDDVYTFDPASWEDSLTTLSSFRQKIAIDFKAEGTGVSSKATYAGEVTSNPSALHSTLAVEGQAASQLPSNQVEVIWIGAQAWVQIGRRPWVPVPVTALESEYAGQVVGAGDLLPFVQQARRVMPDETINGIACKHYTYDLNNLQSQSGMTSAQGDIWVARDGGYVVRLTMNGQGTYYGTYASSGALNLVYDLYDVNVPISINPPR